MRQLFLGRVTKKTHGGTNCQKLYSLVFPAVVVKNGAGYALGHMNAPFPNASKELWRRWAKEARAGLPKGELSEMVVKQLERWPPYKEATHVLTYAAFGSEFDLSALKNKKFYLTRTVETPPAEAHAS